MKEFNKVKSLVIEIMEAEPRARGDDKFLTLRVMQRILHQTGPTLTIRIDQLRKLPAFETVKRTRASIQNVEGRLLPMDRETMDRREYRREEVRAWATKERTQAQNMLF